MHRQKDNNPIDLVNSNKEILKEKITGYSLFIFLGIHQILKMKSMKKVLVMLLVAFATYGSTFALDLNEYEVFYKLNNETTMKSLSRYLQLNDCQKSNLVTEFKHNESNIRQAIQNSNAIAAEEAMNLHLSNLKSLLTEEQYNKFVIALNATIDYNREIQYLAAE